MKKSKLYKWILGIVLASFATFLIVVAILNSGAGPSRSDGARIMTDMGEMRVITEKDYYNETRGYAGLNCSISPEMQVLCDDINKRAESQLVIHSSKYSYCAYALLPNDQYHSNKYGCVFLRMEGPEDRSPETSMRVTSINPGGKGYCDGINFICPPAQ